MAPVPLTERFFTCGNCNIKPGRFDQFITGIGKLAEYGAANEPGLLSYYWAVPYEYADDISASDNVLAFESYNSRDDYSVHMNSPAIGDFMKHDASAMSTGLDIRRFSCVGGFLDSSGEKAEGEMVNTIQIRCHGTEQQAEFLGALKLLIGLLEGRDKAGMLTFLGLKSVDDDVSAKIVARYTTRKAWETWQRDDLFAAFWETAKPCIASKVSRVYVPSGKGWMCR